MLSFLYCVSIFALCERKSRNTNTLAAAGSYAILPAESRLLHNKGSALTSHKTLICFGDSLTEGAIGASYVDILRERLPAAIRVINAGINGDNPGENSLLLTWSFAL